MKKAILCLLCLTLAAVIVPGYAESGGQYVATIDYEGAWVPFPEQNFQLFLPADWLIVNAEDTGSFVVMNSTQTQMMWIDMYGSEGFTIDGILEAFSATEGFEQVQAVYFNGVAFVTYNIPASDMFGATTMAADGSSVFFFKFKPLSDPDLGTLATKIMASLAPVEAE